MKEAISSFHGKQDINLRKPINSTTYQEIQDGMIDIIGRHFYQVDRNTIVPNTRLRADLNADSLDMIQIIMEMERKFNITISEENADALDTETASIRNYTDFVCDKKGVTKMVTQPTPVSQKIKMEAQKHR